MRAIEPIFLLLWCSIFGSVENNCNQRYVSYCQYDCYSGNSYVCTNEELSVTYKYSSAIEIICLDCTITYLTSFSHQQNLRKLEIINSYLPNVTMGMFNNIIHLSALILKSNNISSVQRYAFSGLRRLKMLDLSFNAINDVQLEDLSVFANVEALDLSFNEIEEVTFPKTLQTLYLAQNKLKMGNRTFSGLYNLTLLDISYNKLTAIADHAFHDLTNLRVLNLSGNSLISFDYGSFAGLNQLTFLNVSFNYITNIPEYVLHDIGNLIEFYLNSNNLSDLNIKMVRDNLPNLSKMSIHDNPWNCNTLSNGIKSLKERLTSIAPGNCINPPSILKICCIKDDTQQTFADLSSDNTNNILQTLNNFFNRDFANSTFYNFFTKDYKAQNFWKYFESDFKRADLFRFFESGFSQSQFYRYFNRDYFNATFQDKIIEKINTISEDENNVNATALKDTLKGMFGELFHALNASNSIETLPENDRFIQQDGHNYKDVLLTAMGTVIVLMILYVGYRKCTRKNSVRDKFKWNQMFRFKSSTVNENDVEIL